MLHTVSVERRSFFSVFLSTNIPNRYNDSILVFFSVSAAAELNRATLTTVDLISTNPVSFRIGLDVRGEVRETKTMNLEVGALCSTLFGGMGRADASSSSGWLRHSRIPLFATLERSPGHEIRRRSRSGWSCRHERAPIGLVVACGGPAIREPMTPRETGPDIAIVRGIGLTSPVAGLDAEGLIDRSLGFVPRDMVRDGLPNFGAMRDDWLGEPRSHRGSTSTETRSSYRLSPTGKSLEQAWGIWLEGGSRSAIIKGLRPSPSTSRSCACRPATGCRKANPSRKSMERPATQFNRNSTSN